MEYYIIVHFDHLVGRVHMDLHRFRMDSARIPCSPCGVRVSLCGSVRSPCSLRGSTRNIWGSVKYRMRKRQRKGKMPVRMV